MGRDLNLSEMTLPKLLVRNAARYGDRVALREKDLGIWKRISFALGLRELGLKAGDKVSILGDNCPEWLYADLATQASAAITVGIYPTDVAVQVRFILDNSNSSFVVCKDQEQVDKVLEVEESLPALKKIIVIDMKGLRKYAHPKIMSFVQVEEVGRKAKTPELFDRMVEATRPDDVAILVYTSGTTGAPKGAMISHRNMISMIHGLAEVLPFNDTDSFVSALPLCHIAERMFSLIFPLYAGCTVNFAESVYTLQEDLREISPTAFLSVPRIWEKMHSGIAIKIKDALFIKRWIFNAMIPVGKRVAAARLEGQQVSLLWRLLDLLGYFLLFRSLRNKLGLLNARILVSGAAPLAPDLQLFYHSIGLPVRESFGMTEASGICSMPASNSIRTGAVGKPIPGIEVKIAEDGEILLRGEPVFQGYYQAPEATANAFENGWLRTGDVGYIDETGQLHIVDRKKDIIITAGGKNVSPSEIENKLKFSPYIKEAIVIGDRRRYLVALIQLETDNVADWAQEKGIAFTTYKSLAEHTEVRELVQGEVDRVNTQLARVETIKKFTVLSKELDHDDDELTATMKVRRSIIEKKFKDLIESMY
jgi:long-chain acyl-CoA synthetase